MMSRQFITKPPALALLIAHSVGVTCVQAQWTVTNLHPPGAQNSRAFAASGAQQAGEVRTGDVLHATLWSGTAASFVNLNATTGSSVWDFASGQQVGYWWSTGDYRACLWNGTASSWVNLSPSSLPSRTPAFAIGTDGVHQVGSVTVGGSPHASMWSGTAASWVDLNPPGALLSSASGISDGQQVGSAYFSNDGVNRASLWTGTAASWVDLSPLGSRSSSASSVSHGEQAGYVSLNGINRASIWRGTAASRVDLHPEQATESAIADNENGKQAGSVVIDGVRRASVWSGTAASWVDLHAILPAGFSQSFACGVSSANGTLYVAGYGYNSTTSRDEALLWTRPCPANFNGDQAVDFFDYLDFLTAFTTASPAADFNLDGVVDFFDYLDFVDAFSAGC